MIKFVIPLNPVTKKNSNVCTKSGAIIASKAYRRYEHDALRIIPPQARVHIAGKVNVKALYYTKINYEKAKSCIDLNNLHNALMDTLVAAGVLADDNSRIVRSTDGSRVLHDRVNPRTEVEITVVDSEETESAADTIARLRDIWRRELAARRKREAEIAKLREWQEYVCKAFTAAEEERPYKTPGDPDTYSQYNEGWQDALDRLDALSGADLRGGR